LLNKRNIELDAELVERIHAVVQPGDEILTLANKRPNVIAAIDRDGIWVETLRSDCRRSGPQTGAGMDDRRGLATSSEDWRFESR